MNLSELNTGERAVIAKVNGHGGFRKRLLEMGFVSGKEVKVVLNAPLKDPIEYEILGYKLSLRREEASKIDVVSSSEAEVALNSDALKAIPGDRDEEQLLADEMRRLAMERHNVIRVALVGNPNCGKTSLFNIASGSHEHVGNYSGVTVDAKEGVFEHGGYKFTLVDLPGTYSLSAYSPEELYVRKNLLEEMPDVVVNVVDASNLERNLYLTSQLIDMNLRTVMALNMYDELRARGDELDIRQLGWLLGMPVCPTVSRTGEGIDKLFDTVIEVYRGGGDKLARHIHINHGPEVEKSIDRLKLILQEDQALRAKYSTRWLAIKYLENDRDIESVLSGFPFYGELEKVREEEQSRLRGILHQNSESAIVDAKYAFIAGALAETYRPHIASRQKKTVTDRIDAVVTNKWLAFPIFIVLLYLVFQVTFSLGNYPMEWIDSLVGWLGTMVGGLLPSGWFRDMLVDGVISGVGSVLVFLPNILILYFFISIMEDSGYMARAAFIVDKLMHHIGLHGKSFIPMVMGFGCNVPAIMATRTIESRKSRMITIAIIPFMSCAGRLPVFVLFAGAFFPSHAPLAMLGIYLLGVVLALLSAVALSKLIKDDDLPFVMELPPYRVPTSKAVFRHTWEKGRQYLQKMATTILICSVIIWVLGYFPRHDRDILAENAAVPEAVVQAGAEGGIDVQQDSYRSGDSYIGMIGKAVSPVLEPLGFNWKMNVSLITGIAAKELVVSSLGVMYAQGDSSADTHLQEALQKDLSLPSAVAYMIFILLYFPCIATFIAIRHETGKWRWAIASCVYTIAVAWVVAFAGFHIAAALI